MKKFSRNFLRAIGLISAVFIGSIPFLASLICGIREHYQGVIIASMGYQADEASAAIEAGLVDAVAFGTGFLANLDLPARIKVGAPFNTANPATFYSPGPAGYTDYLFMS